MVSDPRVQAKITDCLEMLQCSLDARALLSAYVVACFPERGVGDIVLFEAYHPLLGAFEMVCASSSGGTGDCNAAFVKAALVYVNALDIWRNRCTERFGFWIEKFDSLRLVVDLRSYISHSVGLDTNASKFVVSEEFAE